MERKNQEYILSLVDDGLIQLSSLKRIFSTINCKDVVEPEQQILIDSTLNSIKHTLSEIHYLFVHKYIAKD